MAPSVHPESTAIASNDVGPLSQTWGFAPAVSSARHTGSSRRCAAADNTQSAPLLTTASASAPDGHQRSIFLHWWLWAPLGPGPGLNGVKAALDIARSEVPDQPGGGPLGHTPGGRVAPSDAERGGLHWLH